MHHNFKFIKKTISVLHRHKVWQQTFNSVKVSISLDGIFTFSLSEIIIWFKTMWILPKALTLYHLLTVIHPINMHSLKKNPLLKLPFTWTKHSPWWKWTVALATLDTVAGFDAAVSEWVWMGSGHHSNFCFRENSPSDHGWTALCSVTAAASRTASSGSACLGHWRPCGWNPGKCPGTFHLL